MVRLIKDKVLYGTGSAGVEVPPWARGAPTDPIYNVRVGAACEQNSDCESNICRDGYCTRPCNPLAPCLIHLCVNKEPTNASQFMTYGLVLLARVTLIACRICATTIIAHARVTQERYVQIITNAQRWAATVLLTVKSILETAQIPVSGCQTVGAFLLDCDVRLSVGHGPDATPSALCFCELLRKPVERGYRVHRSRRCPHPFGEASGPTHPRARCRGRPEIWN